MFFRNYAFILIVILMGSTLEVGAKPITIFGLNMGMADLKTEAEKQGYSCEREEDIWGTLKTICSSGKKKTTINADKITFNCHVFNGCGYSLKEVAQNVANQGLVPGGLQYSRENVGGYNSGIVREDYCARGTDGDILCVVATTYVETSIEIEIQKGTLGQGGMSFN